ncbi:DUF6653 family protein [Halosimplex halobium]|uniref:DUF6653 family protein n=1 Tax=Halosimplex halobium TaxID=3396618 RepID=UPI003F54BD6D
MSTTVPSERLAEFLWERHANPWSGWTRVFAFPVLVYAILTRRRRLLVAAVAAIAVNPVVLPQPDDAQAWTSDVIQAERYWVDHGKHGAVLRSLDAATLPVTVGALYAAYRRKPRSTAVLTALSMALKFAFVNALVRHYEAETGENSRRAAMEGVDANADGADRDAAEDAPDDAGP